MKPFKVIIVEDVPLELKGTEGIIRSDIPRRRLLAPRTMRPLIGNCLSRVYPT